MKIINYFTILYLKHNLHPSTFTMDMNNAASSKPESPKVKDVCMMSLPGTPTKVTPTTMDDLITRLAFLEIENVALRNKLVASNPDRITRTMKMLFYHDNKTRQDVIGTLEDRLKKANLAVQNRAGKILVPWRMIKECTDLIWNDIEEDVKETYRGRAIDKIIAKI